MLLTTHVPTSFILLFLIPIKYFVCIYLLLKARPQFSHCALIPILPSLRFPAPLFVTTLRLRLGLPHPCLATYAACSCGHPLDPLGTHLLRTSSHDVVRDAVYHIIRESRQHMHRERIGFLPSLASRERGGRVDIVISDAAVGHTLGFGGARR